MWNDGESLIVDNSNDINVNNQWKLTVYIDWKKLSGMIFILCGCFFVIWLKNCLYDVRH